VSSSLRIEGTDRSGNAQNRVVLFTRQLGGRDRVRAMVRGDPRRESRRDSRLMLSVPLASIIELVCWSYQIEPAELGERGSRHPARAALVYLTRNHTMANNAELAAVLGLSRAESVPNPSRRVSEWLATDARTRKKLGALEEELEGTR
jgi:hypothetical protein